MLSKCLERLALGLSLLACAACSNASSGGGSTPVAFALLEPVGAETWTGVHAVLWSSDGVGTVEIRLSSDSGATYPTTLASVDNDGSFAWDTMPLTDANSYRILLLPIDTAGDPGTPVESPADFTLDHTAPTLVLDAPAPGEILGGGTETIRWTTTDTNPDTVEIRLSSDSGASYPTLIGVVPDSSSFDWDTTSIATGTTYRLRLSAVDRAGNTSAVADSPIDITIDHAPRVNAAARFHDTDGDGALGAGDELVVPFDADLAVAGALGSDFELFIAGDSFGTTAAVALGPASNELTITLGTSPMLVTRGVYDALELSAGSPSGLDLAPVTTPGAITHVLLGVDALASTPVDIQADFYDAGVRVGGSEARAADTGDVDGDGDLDLVLGLASGPGQLYTNDGSGSWTLSATMLPIEAEARAGAVRRRRRR